MTNEEMRNKEHVTIANEYNVAEGIVSDKEENGRGKKKTIISENVGQMIIFITLLALVVLLPIGRIVSDMVGLFDTMIVQGTFMLVIFSSCIVIIFIEGVHKRISWKKYAIPYACLIIGWLFSLLMSLNVALPKFALLGNAYRGEGLLQIGGYYGIFIIASLLVKDSLRTKIIYVILGVASIFSLLGILQLLNINMLGTFFNGMASLGFGNPNFFASFTVLFAGIAMGGFWLYREDSKFFHPISWWNRKIWFLLVGISYIGCLTSRCSVIYVGLIMMFLLLLFFNIIARRKSGLQILEMFILFVVIMVVLNILSNGSVWKEASSTAVEIKKEGSVFGDSVGTLRMKIWKEMLGLLPMYWLYGCGIEHLGYVHFFTYGPNEMLQMADKAHNEYLDMWLTRGIIPLILYLVFLFALFIPGVVQYIKKDRYEHNDIKMMAIIPFFGYIAQAFFNISMPCTAPYFWLICGFLVMSRKSEENKVNQLDEKMISIEETTVFDADI